MKKNNHLNKKFIEIDDLIRGIWRDKLIILILISIFGILGYSYGLNKQKLFKSDVRIKILNKSEFYKFTFFEEYYSAIELDNLQSDFNQEFNINLLSNENINKFHKKNNIKNSQSNWISIKNATTEGNKKNFVDYSLVFKKPFPAEKILNDYFLFTLNETETKFKKQMTFLLLQLIEKYNKNLNYALKSNINYPVHNPYPSSGYDSGKSTLFLKGSVILSEELNDIKNKLNQLENFSFEKKIFLQKPSAPSMISKNEVFFAVVAMVLGIFISIFLVLSRLILFEK